MNTSQLCNVEYDAHQRIWIGVLDDWSDFPNAMITGSTHEEVVNLIERISSVDVPK